MKLRELKNKKVCFLGLGIDNLSLIRFLIRQKKTSALTVADQRTKSQLAERYQSLSKFKKIGWQLGKNYDRNLARFEIIVRAPGYPLFSQNLAKANARGVTITSAVKLFLANAKTLNIIGVTGTKGKGTTASLIHRLLKATGKKSYLGGNIGVPVFDFFPKLKKNDWVVLELSSFQLEDLEVSPKIAVITNFYPEHLSPADAFNPNYHQTLSGYWQSKLNIARLLDKKNLTVLNLNLKPRLKNKKINSRLIYFKKSRLTSKLIGEHNRENVGAAVAVSKLIGLNQKLVAKAIANFKGLEHRLELTRNLKQVSYYNDSFATTKESAITALKSFNRPIILLAGGADKGASFNKLAKEVKQRVKFVILFKGQASPKIKKQLLKVGFPATNITTVNSMRAAVRKAFKIACANEIVLLSPACASFGLFKNYKQRGRLFKEQVRKLR